MTITAIHRQLRATRMGRGAAGPIVLRRCKIEPLLAWGTRAPYAGDMAEARIDRDAWAVVVRSLMDAEADGNQTHFAAIVGVDRKTVARWLAGAVDVSEDKVRAVARSLNMSARELLVRVGYYQADELPAEYPSPLPKPEAAIEIIRNSDLSPAAKRELIAHITQQLDDFRQQQIREVGRLIDMAERRRRRAG